MFGLAGIVAIAALLVHAPEAAPADPKCAGYESDPRPQIVISTHTQYVWGTEEGEVICGSFNVVNAGGGDDTIIAGSHGDHTVMPQTDQSGGGSLITGGTGRDELYGSLGDDTLIGDEFNDDSAGVGDLGSADVLRGGAGMDFLEGGPGPDVIDGGEGYRDLHPRPYDPVFTPSYLYEIDAVTYERTESVFLSLDGLPNDGAAGEGDNISTDTEGLSGGFADDVLIGSADHNTLGGLAGDDVLIGGGGHYDMVDGGPGDDFADLYDAQNELAPAAPEFGEGIPLAMFDDRFRCNHPEPPGTSIDTVIADWNDAQFGLAPYGEHSKPAKGPPDGTDTREGSCNLVEPAGTVLRRKQKSLSVRVSCEGSTAPCKGTIVVRRAGRTLAAAPYSIKAGAKKRVRLAMKKRGAAGSAAKRGRLRVRVIGNTGLADGYAHSAVIRKAPRP